MALLSIKQNEAAAEAAGIDTLKWKLCAITLSGAIAGAVGAFYAVVLLVVTPVSVFGMLVSAQALTVTLFGGVGTVWGPVIGAAILIPSSETFHAELGNVIPGIQNVIYGLAIVFLILVAPEGMFWKARDFASPLAAPVARRRSDEANRPRAHHRRHAAPRATVRRGRRCCRCAGCRSFGGLKAVQDVSFNVASGTILGIIGPNGAGKTTVFNLLNGFLRPDAGQIVFDGRNVMRRKPHRCAGRRRPHLPDHAAVRAHVGADNVVIGAYVARPRTPRRAALRATRWPVSASRPLCARAAALTTASCG